MTKLNNEVNRVEVNQKNPVHFRIGSSSASARSHTPDYAVALFYFWYILAEKKQEAFEKC